MDDDAWEAVEALFDAHAEALRGYLAGRAGAGTADDLVSETFLVAFRRWSGFDPTRGTARSWLFGIATNLLRHHWRTQQRHLELSGRSLFHEPTRPPFDDSADGRLDAAVTVRRLLPHLALLDAVDLDILLLSAWAGLAPIEIADALSLPPATVRTKLHRVRLRLREALPFDTPAHRLATIGDTDDA